MFEKILVNLGFWNRRAFLYIIVDRIGKELEEFLTYSIVRIEYISLVFIILSFRDMSASKHKCSKSCIFLHKRAYGFSKSYTIWSDVLILNGISDR